jgi:hypothetical protein
MVRRLPVGEFYVASYGASAIVVRVARSSCLGWALGHSKGRKQTARKQNREEKLTHRLI